MEEIEVGEYVRDKKGLFGKCKSKYIDSVRLDFQDGTIIATIDHTGYNHSKNIIDLIEVGDIVDIKTGLYSGYKYFVETEEHLDMLKKQTKEFWVIKTILTHEQYSNNSYKVVE